MIQDGAECRRREYSTRCIQKAISEGRAFIRCIRNPDSPSKEATVAESNAEKEFRKILRKPGLPTDTKACGVQDGNPMRSVTLVGGGPAMTFSYVGFGLIDPHISQIVDVSLFDMGLGFGKRKAARYENQLLQSYGANKLRGYFEEEKTKRTAEKDQRLVEKLDELRNQVLTRGTFYFKKIFEFSKEVCNEVVMRVRQEDIAFIFFNAGHRVLYADKCVDSLEKKQILAIYLQKLLYRRTGVQYPIIAYDNVREKVHPFHYDESNKSWLLDNVTSNMMPQEGVGFYRAFADEIHRSPILKTRFYQFATQIMDELLKEKISNSKALMKLKMVHDFLGKDMAKAYFHKNAQVFLREHQSKVAVDPIKVSAYFRYVQQIEKLTSVDALRDQAHLLKEVISTILTRQIDSVESYERHKKLLQSIPENFAFVYQKDEKSGRTIYEQFYTKLLVRSVIHKKKDLLERLLKVPYVNALDEKQEREIIHFTLERDQDMFRNLIRLNFPFSIKSIEAGIKIASYTDLGDLLPVLKQQKENLLEKKFSKTLCEKITFG